MPTTQRGRHSRLAYLFGAVCLVGNCAQTALAQGGAGSPDKFARFPDTDIYCGNINGNGASGTFYGTGGVTVEQCEAQCLACKCAAPLHGVVALLLMGTSLDCVIDNNDLPTPETPPCNGYTLV
jgi:hypothetical protein